MGMTFLPIRVTIVDCSAEKIVAVQRKSQCIAEAEPFSNFLYVRTVDRLF